MIDITPPLSPLAPHTPTPYVYRGMGCGGMQAASGRRA